MTICIPKEPGDDVIPEPRCPWGFKIARCKICNAELKAAGHFCPEHVPIYIIPENKGYKS
jgi:hypothetical protein